MAGAITVRPGTGEGVYAERPLYQGDYDARELIVAGLTGDEIPDLAVAGAEAEHVAILEGAGDGSFLPRAPAATTALPVR